jgi:hypothetical protein
MKISAAESLGHELKHHKPWFDEKCSKLLDQRNQAKLQWLQNTSQTNGDNLSNITHKTSRPFRNEKRECLKEKLMSLKQTVRTEISQTYIRGINELKKHYQRRSNLVKNENGDLLADS